MSSGTEIIEDKNINNGSPIAPGFVVYESGPGQKGYDLPMALASVGQGWEGLIKAVFTRLEDTDVYVIQVKEKYGRLTIYLAGHLDRYIEGYVDGLCAASDYICEICGNKAMTRSHGGWYATLCDRHDKERYPHTHQPMNEYKDLENG